MWRRVVSSSLAKLRNQAPISSSSSSPSPSRWSTLNLTRRSLTTPSPSLTFSSSATAFQRSAALSSPLATTASDGMLKRKVEDVMPIATGHEREELEAGLEGRDILEINYPVGPFGTKESPAIVQSVYDKRIVGCPGGEKAAEDEHDVVWFWLEKGKPHECPVCSQYFMLEVIGPGGPPPGYGDHDHH